MIDKKGDIFGVRMAPEDKDKLGELAHAQRRSRSDVVRALVRQAYEAQVSTSTMPSPPPGRQIIELRESMPGAPSVMDLIQELRERKSPDAALLDLQSAARDLVSTLTPQAVAESSMSTDSLLALTQDLIDVLRVLADGLRQRQDGAGTASSQK